MIYVHIPFCKSWCIYCDFYSELAGKEEDFGSFADELVREARSRDSEIRPTLKTNTLYIGGGTPSVLPLSVLKRIITSLDYGPYSEFTLEVNPEDIVEKGAPYLQELKSLGVNRISMGVQSLNDPILGWMNRRHDARGARKAFDLARKAGFENISTDVIFGIRGLGDDILVNTLEEIIGWGADHVSAYQLSIEQGSALCKLVQQGKYKEADEDQCASQYKLICETLSKAGYEHYEISNWAKPGKRAQHNSAYWTRQPYVGLGPGAHSLKGTDIRSWNSDTRCGWTSQEEHLTDEQIREERLMLGLRTSDGVDGLTIPEKDWFISDSLIADIIWPQS